MCDSHQLWDQLFADLISQRQHTQTIIRRLEHIMTAQNDINNAVTALTALLADIAAQVTTLQAAVTAISAELAGQGVDTSALDAEVANIAAVQASLDTAASQVSGLATPPANGD